MKNSACAKFPNDLYAEGIVGQLLLKCGLNIIPHMPFYIKKKQMQNNLSQECGELIFPVPVHKLGCSL